jgi:hypothetical protein
VNVLIGENKRLLWHGDANKTTDAGPHDSPRYVRTGGLQARNSGRLMKRTEAA